MNRNKRHRCLGIGAAAILSIGILPGAGCTEEEMDVVLTGMSMVADEFVRQDEPDDISFGDWLASELSD